MKHRREFVTWTGEIDGIEIKPALRLRLFEAENPRRVFVEAYVWAHFWQLRSIRGASQRDKTLGFFKPTYEERTEKDRRGRTVGSKKIGEIHLCLKHCTYNTIAHEAYHATRHFARRMKLVEAATTDEAEKERIHWGMPEERNARFQGTITDLIVAACLDYIGKRKRRSR